jgi:hypothetical protein
MIASVADGWRLKTQMAGKCDVVTKTVSCRRGKKEQAG